MARNKNGKKQDMTKKVYWSAFIDITKCQRQANFTKKRGLLAPNFGGHGAGFSEDLMAVLLRGLENMWQESSNRPEPHIPFHSYTPNCLQKDLPLMPITLRFQVILTTVQAIHPALNFWGHAFKPYPTHICEVICS